MSSSCDKRLHSLTCQVKQRLQNGTEIVETSTSIYSNPCFSWSIPNMHGTWNRHVFCWVFSLRNVGQRPPVDVVFQRMPRSNAAPLRLYRGGSWSLACRPWFKPFKLDTVQTCTFKSMKIFIDRDRSGKESMCTMGIYRMWSTPRSI